MMIDGKNKDDLYDEDAALYTVSTCQHFLARMLWLHVIACDCMWLHIYVIAAQDGRMSVSQRVSASIQRYYMVL